MNFICAVPKKGFLILHNMSLEESKKYCILETENDVPFRELLDIEGKLYHCCSRTLNKDSDNRIIVALTSFDNEEDLKIEEEITCPYCGEESSDSWERDDSDDEVFCDGCKSIYSYERNNDVTYWSRPVSKNEKVRRIN
jgi:DNA-directed RNA polymerase subunit RPC12/RpoP